MALGWLKVIIPLLIQIAKELFVPGTPMSQTSLLMRISVLANITLLIIIVFTGERAILVNNDYIRASVLEQSYKERLIECKEELREDDQPPPSPAPIQILLEQSKAVPTRRTVQ